VAASGQLGQDACMSWELVSVVTDKLLISRLVMMVDYCQGMVAMKIAV
jgi:hypothetical protein